MIKEIKKFVYSAYAPEYIYQKIVHEKIKNVMTSIQEKFGDSNTSNSVEQIKALQQNISHNEEAFSQLSGAEKSFISSYLNSDTLDPNHINSTEYYDQLTKTVMSNIELGPKSLEYYRTYFAVSLTILQSLKDQSAVKQLLDFIKKPMEIYSEILKSYTLHNVFYLARMKLVQQTNSKNEILYTRNENMIPQLIDRALKSKRLELK